MGESFVFCPARLDSRLDSRFARESRIVNRVENRDSQRTVNLLLNGTVSSLKRTETRKHNFNMFVSYLVCTFVQGPWQLPSYKQFHLKDQYHQTPRHHGDYQSKLICL